MKIKRFAVLGILSGLCPSLYADFTQTETTQITGGALVGMMKMAGAFSKQARQAGEPVVSTVMVKGNRMMRSSALQTEIIDLDHETITQIDTAKRQYTVMTFAQMKQQMDAAIAKAKAQRQKGGQESTDQAANTEVKFQVHVRSTGATKEVAGLGTTESILTMAMDAKDKTSGQTGSLAMTNDMWMAPEVPGYEEVRDFYRRFAVKLGVMMGGAVNTSMLAALQPGSAEGMADMVKEMSKLKGIPVLQVLRMGTTADGTPLPAASEAPLPASNSPTMPSTGDVANNAAHDAIASRLGALGGFGGFGRKKKADVAPEAAADSAGAAPATAAVLMESTTQLSGFSQATVDGSRFDVPAGYKQVEPKNLD
ncbi:MAG TPA: hypothetical protein VK627_01120 [Edaphobacter sp.]|nr:hypothetical protein [Edaphobacter sp.]